MVNMLQKLRTRRAINKAATNNNVKSVDEPTNKGGIFRRLQPDKSMQSPSIEQAITMTLSEDDSVTMNESILNESRGVVFSEKDIMDNELNHMRKITDREQEIAKMKVVIEELKNLHHSEIAEKNHEISQVTEELTMTQNKLVETQTRLLEHHDELAKLNEGLLDANKELSEVYHELSDMDEELRQTKGELAETKDTLQTVSTVLMQAQYEKAQYEEEVHSFRAVKEIGKAFGNGFMNFWAL